MNGKKRKYEEDNEEEEEQELEVGKTDMYMAVVALDSKHVVPE